MRPSTRIAPWLAASVLAGCTGTIAQGEGAPSTNPGNADAAVDAAGTTAPIDATPPADARTDRFRCLGQPLPTTGAASVRLAGKVQEIQLATSPSSGARIAMLKRGSGDSIATATTAGDGTYSLSGNATGTAPIDGFMRISKAGFIDTDIYPPSPWTKDEPASDGLLITLTALNFAAGQAKVTRTAGTSILSVGVIDCDRLPVQGAVVTVKSGGAAVGKTVYLVNNKPDSTATSTGPDGAAFVFNVSPGEVEVTARTADGQELRAHTVTARGDVAVATPIAP